MRWAYSELCRVTTKDGQPLDLAGDLPPMHAVYERNSTFMTEFRAGCVLFMTSAYM